MLTEISLGEAERWDPARWRDNERNWNEGQSGMLPDKDKPQKREAKWGPRHKGPDSIWFDLASSTGESRESETRRLAALGWGGWEDAGLTANGNGLFWKQHPCSEIECGDGGTTLWTHSKSLNCTFFFFGCVGGLRDLRSPTRDQTLGPGCESAKSYPLAGQGIPWIDLF